MRRVPFVLGVVFVLVGIVWTLQGTDVLGGSFMSGDPLWLGIGIVLLVVGAFLLVLGVRPASSGMH